jgi:hypothetical protein
VSMRNGGVPAGRMSWADAVAGPLAGTTCLWQDLDGLHVEAVPRTAPPTSIVWGWLDGGRLVRARLDGSTAFVAVLDCPDGGGPPGAVRALPWSAGDGRVEANRGRGPDSQSGGVGATYEQVIVDGISDGTGPVTFIRPASQS